jgi:hypothetical protein
MQKRVRMDDNWVLARGQKVHGPRWFRVEEHLGRGAFAAAYRVTDADGEEYFLKEYLPPERPAQRPERTAMYRQERRILMRVSGHELCPTLHAAFSDSGFDYLVQSFVHGRDLETVLASHEPRGEARILRWAVCLTRAVAHLHARRIVHQDLKPANIRLNLNDDPVLLDFGAAHDFSLDEAASAEEAAGEYGTDGYMPPERARGVGAPLVGAQALEAGCQADVFALGAILVEAMIGQRLTQEEINAQKARLFGALIHSATLPAAFVKAVFKALAYDPRQRYVSAEAMLEELLPIAPPVGRVDQRYLDFGRVEPGVPLKRMLSAYNAGGSVLQGQVEVEGDWLHVSVPDGHGPGGRSFTGNRQQVVVMALPERVPRREVPTEGEIRFVFPSGLVRVRCAVSRTALPAEVHVSPSYLQIRPAPLGRTAGSLLFENRGEMPAAVVLRAHPSQSLALEPAEFDLDAGSHVAVQVESRPAARQAEHLWDWLHRPRRAADADPVAARPAEYLLEWQVNGEPGGFVPLEVVSLWSLPRSVTSRFRRPGIDEGVRE